MENLVLYISIFKNTLIDREKSDVRLICQVIEEYEGQPIKGWAIGPVCVHITFYRRPYTEDDVAHKIIPERRART